jgi:DNA helicase-2/ATP-dependent DNA helicase PcrA
MRKAAIDALRRMRQIFDGWGGRELLAKVPPSRAAAVPAAALPAAPATPRPLRAPRRQLPEASKKAVLWRQKYHCASCGCLLPPTYELDHLTPLAAGGTDGLANLQALCRACHVQKTRLDMGDIAAIRRGERAERRQRRGGADGGGGASEPASEPALEPASEPASEPAELLFGGGGVLDGLNEEQLAAVRAPTFGARRVRAGPGTGKTRVLVARVAHLLLGPAVDPRAVLALTFTNKAANALRAQLRRCAGIAPEQAEQIAAGTFHSVCLRMLRDDIDLLAAATRAQQGEGGGGGTGVGAVVRQRRGFGVYDELESRKLVGHIMRHDVEGAAAAAAGEGEQPLKPSAVQSLISTAKNEGMDAAAFAAGAAQRGGHTTTDWALVAEVFRRYEEALAARNVIDFDDMLIMGARLLETNAAARRHYRSLWRHVVVDEFQDTNPLQYRFLKLLALPEDGGESGGGDGGGGRSVFVVGDANQAIYTWRGADAQNVAKFDRDFGVHGASMHNLQLNYRSKQAVLDAAMGVIAGEPSCEHAGERLLLQAAGAVAALPPTPGAPTITVARTRCDRDEAAWVVHMILRLRASSDAGGADDVGILCRTNAQTLSFERALLLQGVPHRLVGNTRFFERKEVRDALAYLRLAVNLDDDAACERIINTPPRRIGAKTLGALRAAANARGTALWGAVAETAAGEGGAGAGAGAKQARGAIGEFHALLLGMRAALRDAPAASPLPDAVRQLLGAAGLEEHLAAQEGGEDRMDAVRELLNMAAPYGAAQLGAFLDEVALLSAPELAENAEDAALGLRAGAADARKQGLVQLMTVHTAKGLEFDTVFVPGFEEELLPHYYAIHPRHAHMANGGGGEAEGAELELERSRAAVAEERRLAFVAITRAKTRCIISHAQRRLVWGHPRRAAPSRFLNDLGALVDAEDAVWLDVLRGSDGGGDAWTHFESAPELHHNLEPQGGGTQAAMMRTAP